MIRIEWPAEMLGNPSEHELAEGPFAMEHNGDLETGSHLERNGTYLMVSGGGRAFTFDDTYTATVNRDRVTFHSEQYRSTFVFRPLTLEDAEWALPGREVESLEGLKAEVLGMHDGAYKTPAR